MHILIIPDSFKESISSQEFCNIAERAILKVFEKAKITKIPMADGGEGTVDVLIKNKSGRIIHKEVTAPLGNRVKAHFGILEDGKTAVIEMAAASGLHLVPEDKRNPMLTTSYGTGELIKFALDEGCKKIIMGIGGSATNDGGAGMLQALGFRLLNSRGEDISYGAEGLLELDSVDTSGKDPRLDDVEIIVACDVDNVLCGPRGAAYVYGPQKGANEEILPILDKALMNFSKIIERTMDKKVANIKGSGAAGGMGAGLMGFLNAELKPGFSVLKEEIGLVEIFEKNEFHLVITGEGQIDSQTLHGKVPIEVGKLAKKYSVPVIAFAGNIGKGVEKLYDYGISSIFTIVNGPISLQESMANGPKLLEDTIERFMRAIKTVVVREN